MPASERAPLPFAHARVSAAAKGRYFTKLASSVSPSQHGQKVDSAMQAFCGHPPWDEAYFGSECICVCSPKTSRILNLLHPMIFSTENGTCCDVFQTFGAAPMSVPRTLSLKLFHCV